ncbi:MAG: hypothetical protein ACUVX8_18060 [Candidatus Zipacnadales bacterium]
MPSSLPQRHDAPGQTALRLDAFETFCHDAGAWPDPRGTERSMLRNLLSASAGSILIWACLTSAEDEDIRTTNPAAATTPPATATTHGSPEQTTPPADAGSDTEPHSTPGFVTGLWHGLTSPLRFWGLFGLHYVEKEDRSDGYIVGRAIGSLIVPVSVFAVPAYVRRLIRKRNHSFRA